MQQSLTFQLLSIAAMLSISDDRGNPGCTTDTGKIVSGLTYSVIFFSYFELISCSLKAFKVFAPRDSRLELISSITLDGKKDI